MGVARTSRQCLDPNQVVGFFGFSFLWSSFTCLHCLLFRNILFLFLLYLECGSTCHDMTLGTVNTCPPRRPAQHSLIIVYHVTLEIRMRAKVQFQNNDSYHIRHMLLGLQ